MAVSTAQLTRTSRSPHHASPDGLPHRLRARRAPVRAHARLAGAHHAGHGRLEQAHVSPRPPQTNFRRHPRGGAQNEPSEPLLTFSLSKPQIRQQLGLHRPAPLVPSRAALPQPRRARPHALAPRDRHRLLRLPAPGPSPPRALQLGHEGRGPAGGQSGPELSAPRRRRRRHGRHRRRHRPGDREGHGREPAGQGPLRAAGSRRDRRAGAGQESQVRGDGV